MAAFNTERQGQPTVKNAKQNVLEHVLLAAERRILHGSFMLSTTILFMGIALFFTLISFVPQYRIEGPETFYRFATAGMAAQSTCLVVGLIFFVKDFRNGWPFMLAGLFFLLNEFIRSTLDSKKLIEPLTQFVGSLNPALTFVGSFAVLLALLAATGMLETRRRGALQGMETSAL